MEISPWFAEIALEELENHCFKILDQSVLFSRHYVDDCFLIVKASDIDVVFNTFNNFNKYLLFTLEEEKELKLNFLDLTIIRKKKTHPVTGWYQKPTATGRYINFNSHSYYTI